MAAPVVRDFRAPAVATSNTLPAGISPAATQTGDMVLCFLWSQGANQATLTHTLQSGFNQVRQHAHDDGTTDGRLSVAWRLAPSGSSFTYAPFAVANATAGQNSIGTVVLQAGTFGTGTFAQNSSTATTNAPPDPPSLTGLNGDVLVLAVAAWHVTTAGTTSGTMPAGYTHLGQNSVSGSHVTHLAIASRALTGLSNATEDPGAFADNVVPNGTAQMTFAVPGSYDGASTATLASASPSLAGSVDVSGASTRTLDGVGRDMSGSVGSSEVSGEGDVALAGLTRSAVGAVDVAGSSLSTLSTLAQSGAGTVAVTGTHSVTLSSLSRSAVGGVTVIGSLATALGQVGPSGAGSADIGGQSQRTLSALTPGSAGSVAVTGSCLHTLASLSPTISGGVDVSAGSSQTLVALSLAATAGSQQEAALDVVLSALSSQGDAGVGVTGALASSLSALGRSSTGSVTLAGQAAAGLSPSSLVSSGLTDTPAVASIVLPSLSTTGAGTVSVAGTSAVTLGEAWAAPPPVQGDRDEYPLVCAVSHPLDWIVSRQHRLRGPRP